MQHTVNDMYTDMHMYGPSAHASSPPKGIVPSSDGMFAPFALIRMRQYVDAAERALAP